MNTNRFFCFVQNNFRRGCCLVAYLLILPYLGAQMPFCASEILMETALQDSILMQQQQLQTAQAYHFFKNHVSAPTSDNLNVLSIPVVVHIIHNGGPENIADAQVVTAIETLNSAFANTGYFAPGMGANTQIQFCLAQRTPGNLPSNGITRDQNTLTNMTAETQNLALKDINRWAPKEYVNIWVVNSIVSSAYGSGIAAYTYYPSSHGSALDGVVCEAAYFGASPAYTCALIHELGHYLGLKHTFAGGCNNNDCLLFGDEVCDTPPDQSSAWLPCDQSVNTCQTDTQSGFTSDQPDMRSNFMDYSPFDCYQDFKQGQADRMNWHLQNPRKSLLDSKGCLPPCPAAVTALFSTANLMVNVGETVNFSNQSTGASSFVWQKDGLVFSMATNASLVFSEIGTFTILLTANSANPDLCSPATFSLKIKVVCPAIANFTASATNVNLGESVTFNNTSTDAGTFIWKKNGVVFSTAASPTLTFTEEGVFSISLVAGYGNPILCQSAEYQVVVQVICPVIANFSASTLSPFMNDTVHFVNTSQAGLIGSNFMYQF